MRAAQSEIFDRNYRKLWLLELTNKPFRYAAHLIRKKWRDVLMIEPNRNYKLIKRQVEKVSDLQNNDFFDDITNLANLFDFDDFWVPNLVIYVLSGMITTPKKRSKTAPPKSIARNHKFFLWNLKKNIQHYQLKKHNYKTVRRKLDYEKGKYITEIDRDLHGDELIHQNENIADIVLGEDETFEKDKQRKNLVKTGVKRFKKYLTPLTLETQRRLQKLFS